jgi:hypothetical protein
MDTLQDRSISVDRLIPLIDVKKALAVSWTRLIEIVRDGTLPVYDVTGQTVDRKQITEQSRGLRIPESALEDYKESIRVK